MAVFRYPFRRERTAPFGSVGLPNHLERKLKDPGPRRQRLLTAPPPLWVPSALNIWALLAPKKGKGGVETCLSPFPSRNRKIRRFRGYIYCSLREKRLMNPVGCFLVPSQPSRAISQSSLALPDTIRRLEQETGPAVGRAFSKIVRYAAPFIASPLATILDSGPFRRGQPFLDKGSVLWFTTTVK